jgi:peptidoglycan/LPS O-acetylase OafA/YrhL/lysophospholipase L1-like esterase
VSVVSGIGAPTLHRVPALDGLRALAVAGVLLFHAGVALLPGGFLGVDVFFVLSGYLITSLLLAERAKTGTISLVRFYSRRARRLLPAVFVLVPVVVLVSVFLGADEAAGVRGDAFSSLLYFNNWHQILTEQSYFEAVGRPSLLRHLWSLSVEEQFYLLWPLVLLFALPRVGARRLLQAVAVVAGLSAILMAVLYDPTKDPSRVYYGTDTRATTLLIGATLAFLWPMRPARGRTGPRATLLLDGAALAGLAAVGLAYAFANEYDEWVYRGGLAAISLACAVLIAAIVHPACRVARPLASAPMVWIGERSYGIYLWHWPVMVMTRPERDIDLSLWILVPLQVAATVGLAAASYRWVEMPFRRGTAQEAIKTWLGRRSPHRRLAIVAPAVLATIAALVWLGTGSSTERSEATNTAAAARAPVRAPDAGSPTRGTGPPLLVGASVMLGSQEALHDRLGWRAVIDAEVGRNPDDIAARLEAYRFSDALPSRVVVQMGENGPIRDEDMARVKAALEGVDRVVLLNVHVPTSWESDVNARLAVADAEWPEAVLADWDKAAKRSLLYDDGIHPTPEGQVVYAKIVQQGLRAAG